MTSLPTVVAELATWLVAPPLVIAALVGLGSLVRPLGRGDEDLPARGLGASAVLGIVVLLAATVAVDLVAPLGRSPGPFVVAVGLALLGVTLRRGPGRDPAPLRGPLRTGLARGAVRPAVVATLTATTAVALVMRVSSLVIPLRFVTDAAIYHLPAMEGMATGPTPVGLAILHGRYGFNPAALLLGAALRWEVAGWTQLFVLEVVVRAVVGLVLVDLWAAARRRGAAREAAFHLASLGVLVPFVAINKGGTDGAVGFLAVATVAVAVRVRAARRAGDEDPDRVTDGWALLVALAALTVMAKLALAPVAVLVLAVLGRRVTLWPTMVPMVRRAGPVLVVTGAAVVLWLTRGTVMTGCLLYPVPSSCLDVPWGVGARDAGVVATIVTEFARRVTPTGAAAVSRTDLTWVRAWVPTWLASLPAIAVAVAVPLGAIGIARGAGTARRRGRRTLAVAVAVIVAGLPLVAAAVIAGLLSAPAFLPVDATFGAILADYPRMDLLRRLPLVGVVTLLAVAVLAPRHAVVAGRSAADRPVAPLVLPAVAIAGAWWFLTGPGPRFGWAIHAAAAALIASPWVRSVDVDAVGRALAPAGRTRSGVAGLAAVTAVGLVVGLAVVDPRVPLEAEPVAVRTVVLQPDGLVVAVPLADDQCWEAYPCALVAPEGVSARRVGGRWVITRDGVRP